MKKVIAIIAILLISNAISWLITCGIVKLITLCLGLTFKWRIATAIWLVMCLLTGGAKIKIRTDE